MRTHISDALAHRIMQAAEDIAFPRPGRRQTGSNDDFYGVELRFMARTASRERYGYARIVTAHALVQSDADVLTMVEDEAVHEIQRAVTEAGDGPRIIDRVEANLISTRGKRIPV